MAEEVKPVGVDKPKKGKTKGGAKNAKKDVAKVEVVPPTQYEILMKMGISEEEIPKF